MIVQPAIHAKSFQAAQSLAESNCSIGGKTARVVRSNDGGAAQGAMLLLLPLMARRRECWRGQAVQTRLMSRRYVIMKTGWKWSSEAGRCNDTMMLGDCSGNYDDSLRSVIHAHDDFKVRVAVLFDS